jgi:LPXTG-motif cell wall-anchored protein
MSDLDNSYDEFDEQPTGGGNNRNFMIAIIAIIVVFVIIVVGVGGFYLLSRSGASSKAPLIGTQAAIIYTQNALTAAAATQVVGTEVAKSLITPATDTPTPVTPQSKALTPTSVVVFPSETPAPTLINAGSTTPGSGIGGPVSGGEGDPAARTATIAALMTQVAAGGTAQASGTLVNPLITPTALPKTGFMDEIGLPLLSGMALLFIFIIFMARRLRVAPNR